MQREVIIACDFPNEEALFAFLEKMPKQQLFLKVGMELFYGAGPNVVRTLKAQGHRVFLDLKLHDIPNTVKSAMKVVAELGADIVNIHASGTVEMMIAAVEGAKSAKNPPKVIAVTQLTSTSEQRMRDDLLIERPLKEVVNHYALNAKNAGLDGVVCSPLEAASVKEVCGSEFITVTPGIRFADGDVGDQVRIATPSSAAGMGCDYIVVGRPITAAPDPLAAYLRCVEEFVK